MNNKPLFIPLKKPYFEAFEAGTKIKEFRPYGPRWNEQTCAIGRRVVLSLGYGKQRRLYGVVAGFERSAEPTNTDAWRECYGDRKVIAACIQVKIQELD